MRIEPQPWMTSPGVAAVFAALSTDGPDPAARFVGGCVRDALIGIAVADIDLATPLEPEMVVARLDVAGIKAIPTGIEHGTVTAVAGPDK